MSLKALLVVDDAPCRGESPSGALRLAEAPVSGGERVGAFVMGDAVQAVRAGQEPREVHVPLETMRVGLLERGVTAVGRGTLCRARRLSNTDRVDGVHVATIHDLAEVLERCERTLSS